MRRRDQRKSSSLWWLALLAIASGCDSAAACAGVTISPPLDAYPPVLTAAPSVERAVVTRADDSVDPPSPEDEPSRASPQPEAGFSVIYGSSRVQRQSTAPPAPAPAPPPTSTVAAQAAAPQPPAPSPAAPDYGVPAPTDEIVILPGAGDLPAREPPRQEAPRPPLNGGPAYEPPPIRTGPGIPINQGPAYEPPPLPPRPGIPIVPVPPRAAH